ncbi:hypothetical protein [Salmonella enterica]|uniref:hypothetical protein n=1 Tax=Salmonella enterica TaxID=28901 RepID=UPI0020CC5851|nr:hypothetical protein [Salmonella enterica]
MTTTTASTVDIPSDNDLTLSAHLTEPAEPTIDMPEIPVAPGNSAQSAAQRLGGKGGHSWPPSSDRRSLMLKVLSVLVFCVLLGTVLFLWFTVRQQQIQLTTLDAAFRSGQLQTLPDRMLETENKLQKLTQRYQADAEKWQQGSTQQKSILAQLNKQMTDLTTDVEAAASVVAQVASRHDETDSKLDALQKSLDTQTFRIDTLTAWKEEWRQRSASIPARTKTSGGNSSAVKKP